MEEAIAFFLIVFLLAYSIDDLYKKHKKQQQTLEALIAITPDVNKLARLIYETYAKPPPEVKKPKKQIPSYMSVISGLKKDENSGKN